MRKTITAIVPVRKGSQRVKNKNFKPFADSNLLEIKLNALKQVKTIDHLHATQAELELLQLEKMTEGDLEMIGYTTTKEFWDRYAGS